MGEGDIKNGTIQIGCPVRKNISLYQNLNYQIFTRSSSGNHMASPFLILKVE